MQKQDISLLDDNIESTVPGDHRIQNDSDVIIEQFTDRLILRHYIIRRIVTSWMYYVILQTVLTVSHDNAAGAGAT